MFQLRLAHRRSQCPAHDAQASLPQIMQCTACNALHTVNQRACRRLLQTRDRVEDDSFALEQEFLAVMLGVQRPIVVLRALRRDGLIARCYGRIQIRAGRTPECDPVGVTSSLSNGFLMRPTACSLAT
jgi:hypothetical protein